MQSPFFTCHWPGLHVCKSVTLALIYLCRIYFNGKIISRLANIIKLSNVSVNKILNAVHTVKSETSLDLECESDYSGDYALLTNNGKYIQVLAVEQQLQINSSDQIIESLTKEELNSAAEMFIYLNTCPDSYFKSWSTFYKDLFLTQPADQITLTLNRMLKTKSLHSKASKDGNLRAEKFLKRTSELLSLKFVELQAFLYEKTIRNGSVKKEYKIPKGII